MLYRFKERKEFLKKGIKHIDLSKINNISNLVDAFDSTSFQSRNLGACSKVFEKMLADKNTTIFLGLSGALIPAGLKKVICDMVSKRVIDVIVSTGANLSHDFYESMGNIHYIGENNADDDMLNDLNIDRIYDTYADDIRFTRTELFFLKYSDRLEDRSYSTREFFYELGKSMKRTDSIIRTSYVHGVPIFCPALNDSAIGIGLTGYYMRGKNKNFIINSTCDNFEIMQIAKQSKTTGVIYLGGGVPKNYIQQIPPMLSALGFIHNGHRYGIQITTDDPKWGGLSGCTFDEAKSWGKIENKAYYATVYCDVTIGLPLLMGSIFEKIKNSKVKIRGRRIFIWKKDKLIKVAYE